MKITNEIFQVGGSNLTASEDAAVYLINFDDHAALIDAGTGRQHDRLLSNIRKCGVNSDQIEYLLLTHCHYDHTGGVRSLQEDLIIETVAHELDVPYMESGDNVVTAASWYGANLTPFTVDRKLTEKYETINLGSKTITAIHTPGHSPGSVVYMAESENNKVLFAQDLHGPIDPELLSNKRSYLESLSLILSLNADILCEGHFGVFKGSNEVFNFIQSFI